MYFNKQVNIYIVIIYICVFKHVLTKVVKLQVAIFHHKSCVDHQASCKEI